MTRPRRRIDPAINLTPLIDILFIVLMFLMLTTTFQEGAAQLRVTLPEASTGEPLPREASGRVRIVIDAEGAVFVADRRVSLDQLRRLLESVPDRRDAQVLLTADATTDHGRVVDVMDLARSVGILRLSIETIRTDRSGVAAEP